MQVQGSTMHVQGSCIVAVPFDNLLLANRRMTETNYLYVKNHPYNQVGCIDNRLASCCKVTPGNDKVNMLTLCI